MTRRRQRSRGQSLVEFAVVFPVFMFMLGGAIQFGLIFWGQNTLNQVVRDAGRFAVTQQDCSTAPVIQKVRDVARDAALIGTLDTPVVSMPAVAPDPTSDPCPVTSNTGHVWIRITASAQVPIFFPFIPGNGAISSTALFRMEPAQP